MPVTDGAARSAGSATAGLREHGDLHPRIWPLTACALAGGEISVGGVPLAEIAACYGTPVYEADVRQRCRDYRQAFGDAEIAYAGKAFLCRAMVRWIDEEGLNLDVCSEGELAVASSAGFPPTGFCCDAAVPPATGRSATGWRRPATGTKPVWPVLSCGGR